MTSFEWLATTKLSNPCLGAWGQELLCTNRLGHWYDAQCAPFGATQRVFPLGVQLATRLTSRGPSGDKEPETITDKILQYRRYIKALQNRIGLPIRSSLTHLGSAYRHFQANRLREKTYYIALFCTLTETLTMASWDKGHR
jgi:aryl carrier-like protein